MMKQVIWNNTPANTSKIYVSCTRVMLLLWLGVINISSAFAQTPADRYTVDRWKGNIKIGTNVPRKGDIFYNTPNTVKFGTVCDFLIVKNAKGEDKSLVPPGYNATNCVQCPPPCNPMVLNVRIVQGNALPDDTFSIKMNTLEWALPPSVILTPPPVIIKPPIPIRVP